MSVISITITESSFQIIPGIPKTITITTNIPAIVFYTLDGSIPNAYSPVYLNIIQMPQNLLSVELNVFSTDGINSSSVITKTYVGNKALIETAVGDRLPHSTTTQLNNESTNNSLFPFGTNSPNPTFNYQNPANAGITVFDQSKTGIPSGFDANGNPAGFINTPTNLDFKQVYSTVNREGEVLPGVGNLPADVEIIGKQTEVMYTQKQSSLDSKQFNRNAMVIIQDAQTNDPTNPQVINRTDFSLENASSEITKDGVLFFNNALDSPTTTGSLVKSYYNPRTNTITYYYYDNAVNRWIISSQPYQNTNPNPTKLSDIAQGRNTKVFQWVVYPRRFLI